MDPDPVAVEEDPRIKADCIKLKKDLELKQKMIDTVVVVQ
jgi:hypothetical protein